MDFSQFSYYILNLFENSPGWGLRTPPPTDHEADTRTKILEKPMTAPPTLSLHPR